MSFDPKFGWVLVLSLGAQSAAALIWAGHAVARLETVERKLETQEHLAERLATLEAELSAARASLERIERRLDAD
ncbi:MAG: hypothetical protein K2P95_07095 [Hyphomonadaceae bacterium]|nr:hypothetical protein [Hyphomonadaceae bacterium]